MGASSRGARGLERRVIARARLPALARYLLARSSTALIPPVAVVASTVVVSAAFGAGTAFLAVGPGTSEEIVSAGPRASVRSASAGFPSASSSAISGHEIPLAERAEKGSPPAGGEGPVPSASSDSGQPATDAARLAVDPGVAPESATHGAPSHSEQGGTSKPPAGSNAGAPPDDEEPTEEVPGEEEEEGAEEAPPEEPPAEEEEKVTVCHKAGSTGAKTLTVGASAAEEHLAHGDTPGACG